MWISLLKFYEFVKTWFSLLMSHGPVSSFKVAKGIWYDSSFKKPKKEHFQWAEQMIENQNGTKKK